MLRRTFLISTVFLLPMLVWAQEGAHLEGAGQAIQGPFFPCTLTTDDAKAVVSHDGKLRSRLESSSAGVRGSSQATATFDVTYTGFTTQAQAAFQHAVDLWAASIESSVTIQVDATYRDLGDESLLGQAGPLNIFANFAGAPEQDVWYVDALADALLGADNQPGSPDIEAEFNSTFDNWYFGLDGAPPDGEFDFVTVVLHELGHGLGFLGSASVGEGAGEGEWGIDPGSGNLLPIVYDLPVEDLNGTPLLDEGTYPNPSAVLGDLLQSNDLYANSLAIRSANGDVPGKLHAPTTWIQGSSYSHWDEAEYPGGTANALMTPSVAPAEVDHDVGPLTCGLFEDMGWVLGPGCGGDPPPSPPSTQELAVEFEGPNPVRTTTIVRVQQSEAGSVRAAIYDVLGRQITTLFDGEAPTELPLQINREGVAAGMYLLDVRGEGGHETLRITFL